ncbi:protein BASIC PENTACYSTEINE2-like [Andrographis paniculata]|uniref:protein BASIC PENTACYSTEINE2-like n=1 Tax=Andrographis paniculata TaxID=175694 RepID=UPI0021E7660C|nr:protein BASIC PENTACYSTEINE2-like [Andrographis paniculata]
MDEDSLRNWGYYEPPQKGHLGLHLMPSMAAERETKPFLLVRDNPMMPSSNGGYHPRNCMVSESPVTQIDYVRNNWINNRDKFMHMFPDNPYNPVLAAEASGTQPAMQMVNQNEIKLELEEPPVKNEDGPKKKRAAPKSTPKAKKPRKVPAPKENGNGNRNGNPSSQRAKTSKRSVEVVINGVDMDITGIPIPVCSCTGNPQQCYRWGCGGWQSACCTTTVSMYPLPMSTKRRGARIAGRKMSQGAFKKVLEKLSGEGFDFSNAIDLRTYWAKHGTNKFVVIR